MIPGTCLIPRPAEHRFLKQRAKPYIYRSRQCGCWCVLDVDGWTHHTASFKRACLRARCQADKANLKAVWNVREGDKPSITEDKP